MWLKYQKARFTSKYGIKELTKRIRSITEEPEDENKNVPSGIYTFKGKVSEENPIKLTLQKGATLQNLDLAVSLREEEKTKVDVRFRLLKSQRYVDLLLIALFFVILKLSVISTGSVSEALLEGLIILGLYVGIATFAHFTTRLFARKRVNDLFSYLTGDDFNERSKFSIRT